jgi:hypothetical protein
LSNEEKTNDYENFEKKNDLYEHFEKKNDLYEHFEKRGVVEKRGRRKRNPCPMPLWLKSLPINIINCIKFYVNCSTLTGAYDWQYKYLFVCLYANHLP